MTHQTLPLQAIETIIHDTLTILEDMDRIPHPGDHGFAKYQTVCRQMPGHIREGRLKIAVVGVIKSGKSTLVNSLVGRELVKRGAGVITSIPTRIRKGKKNRASIYFKSWDEINAQVQKALVLFPHEGPGEASHEGPVGGLLDPDRKGDFDIRRENDRTGLEKVYQTLVNDFPAQTDEIRPETLLIRNALLGYDACSKMVQADETVVRFESKAFDRHKAYTADPSRAFYVRDVCLEVFGRAVEPHIEIADCQGADSTDPAQLAQVLSYLESSNLIVYCISSRTGLRQADMDFLHRIKNLGLLENLIFINNCDLTEHENLGDLMKIENRIRDDLKLLGTCPKLFSFSALYNLFSRLESKLPKKESARFNLWQEEKQMNAYCHSQTEAFFFLFNQLMDKNRHDLLISNHLKRLDMIMTDLALQTRIFIDLLSSDKKKETAALKTLETLHQNASRLESIVSNSIEGAVKGLETQIASNLKQVFDQDDQAILKKLQVHIQTCSIDVEKYRSVAGETGFNRILYLMFQDFKRNLDLYVIEAVRPQLKKTIALLEDRIILYFQSLFDSYQIDLPEPRQYSRVEDLSKFIPEPGKDSEPMDINKIKKILGLELPAMVFEAEYSPGIRAGVLSGFGLQTLVQVVKSLFQKSTDFSFSQGLKKAGEKIKRENQRVMKEQFDQYHRNLWNHYFLPLIQAATRDFKEKTNDRFTRYRSFKQELEHVFSLKQAQKEDRKKRLVAIDREIRRVSEEIASLSEVSW